MSDPAAAGEARLDIEPIFRRILKNAGKLLGGRAVNGVLSLAYLALAARALGVEAFGVLVLIHAFAQLLGEVLTFQSWQTVLQYGAAPLAQGRQQALHRVIRFSALLDGASGLFGVLVGVALALSFGDKLGWGAADNPLAAAYALTILVMAASTPLGLLRLFDRFDVVAGQVVATAIVRLIGCGIGYLMHLPLSFFLVIWAAGEFVGFLALMLGVSSEMKKRGLLEDFSLFGPIEIGLPGVWRFAWATNFNTTLAAAFTHVITLMVGAFLGPAQSALWRIGWQVSNAIAKPAKLLTPALYPEFARLRASQGEHTMWRLTRRIALAAGGIGAVLLAISLFAGPILLKVIMGPDFVGAAGVMSWQVAAVVISLFALPLEPLVISLGYATAALRVRIVIALAFIAALPPLIINFGIDAAGAGLVAATFALSLGLLWLATRPSIRASKVEQVSDSCSQLGN